MGLDIRAYSKLVERPDLKLNDDREAVVVETGEVLEDFDYIKPYMDQSFGMDIQYQGLNRDALYEPAGETFGFRAGSYMGYNVWRDHLAKLAGYKHGAQSVWNGERGPFAELINFSDCDGTLGPVVAAKLLRDFQEFESKAREYNQNLEGDWRGYFIEKYEDWTRAFTLAADGGAVDFR